MTRTFTDREMDARVEETARELGRDRTVVRRFDPSIVRQNGNGDGGHVEPEREWWRARSEKRCAECGGSFMPRARATKFCDGCAAGRNGSGSETAPGKARKAADSAQPGSGTSAPAPPRAPRPLTARLLDVLSNPQGLAFLHDLVNLSGASEREVLDALGELQAEGLARPTMFKLTGRAR